MKSIIDSNFLAHKLTQYRVNGVSLTLLKPLENHQCAIDKTLVAGMATANKAMTDKTWLQTASLSKSIASAFTLEYFTENKLSIDIPVNKLLLEYNSSFTLPSNNNSDEVTVRHLLNHTALNIHYVNGFPLDGLMPNIENLIFETSHDLENQYNKVQVINKPGTFFQYSGGGYLVLQYLLEIIAKKPIESLLRPFLDALGMSDYSFDAKYSTHSTFATGYKENGTPIEGGRLQFPALAAGGEGTTVAMAKFVMHLINAFHSSNGSGVISHNTAVNMLYAEDKGSQKFMAANMGLGVFVTQNHFILHQGANDGFRAFYIAGFAEHCGKGAVCISNGDNNAAEMNADILNALLTEWEIIDNNDATPLIDSSQFKQEEKVNQLYRATISKMKSAQAERPKKQRSATIDPLSSYNIAVTATITSVSNEAFALADNLLCETIPVFDPEEFGMQGKIMDSWETARHNAFRSGVYNDSAFDELILSLATPSPIHYVSISTMYHDGNHAEMASLEGKNTDGKWVSIIPKNTLLGHKLHCFNTSNTNEHVFVAVRLKIYPDGGITRLGLYAEKPPTIQIDYLEDAYISFPETPGAINHLNFNVTIPKAKKHQALNNKNEHPTSLRAISASNQHYGPANAITQTSRPTSMQDGFETRRTRNKENQEWVMLKLEKASKIKRLEIDFSFFIHNNPVYVAIETCYSKHNTPNEDATWEEIVTKTFVKPYAGNTIAFDVEAPLLATHIRIMVYPDGGFNRVSVFSD